MNAAIAEPASTVCTQSGGGFRGELVRCTNAHCGIHGGDAQGRPRLLRSGEQASIHTLRHLWELRVELEKKFASGPWDSWDGRLLEKWLEDVKRTINDAELDLSARLEPEWWR